MRIHVLSACAVAGSLVMAVAGHAQTVGYFTDYGSNTGQSAAITAASLTPVAITDFSKFDFSSVSMVFLDESNNGAASSVVKAREADLLTYVNAGGKVVINDRGAGLDGNSLIPGGTGITLHSSYSSNLDVATPGTLLTNGPAGVITNTTLDGGNSSAHGYADLSTLPIGAVNLLLEDGIATHSAAFSFRQGNGYVYYSTVPLDYYLTSGSIPAFKNIYAPNMLAYVAGLQTGNVGAAAVPEPGSMSLIACLGVSGTGLLARRRKTARKAA